jgi:hypothetical protein
MNVISLIIALYPAIINANSYGDNSITTSNPRILYLRKTATNFEDNDHHHSLSMDMNKRTRSVSSSSSSLCIEESKRSDFYIIENTSNCPVVPHLVIHSQQGQNVTISVSPAVDDVDDDEGDLPWFHDDCSPKDSTEPKTLICEDGMAIVELQATIHPCSGEYICRTQYAVLCSPSKCWREEMEIDGREKLGLNSPWQLMYS